MSVSTRDDARLPTVATRYWTRRPLGPAERGIALGIGVAVGAAAFYLAQLLLRKAPLAAPPASPTPRPPARRLRAPSRPPATRSRS